MAVYSQDALKDTKGNWLIIALIAAIMSLYIAVCSIYFMVCRRSYPPEMVNAINESRKMLPSHLGNRYPRALIQAGGSYCTVALDIYNKRDCKEILQQLDDLLAPDYYKHSAWKTIYISNIEYYTKTWYRSRFGQLGVINALPLSSIDSIVRKIDAAANVVVQIPAYLKLESHIKPLSNTYTYKWYRIQDFPSGQVIAIDGRLLIWPHIVWIFISVLIIICALGCSIYLSVIIRKPQRTCEEALVIINKWQPLICLYLPLLVFIVMGVGIVTGNIYRVVDQWHGFGESYSFAVLLSLCPVLSVPMISGLISETYKYLLMSAIKLHDLDIAPQERNRIRDKSKLILICMNVGSSYILYISILVVSPIFGGILLFASFILYLYLAIKTTMYTRLQNIEMIKADDDPETWVLEKTRRLSELSRSLTDQLKIQSVPVTISSKEMGYEKLFIKTQDRKLFVSIATVKEFSEEEIRFLMAAALIRLYGGTTLKIASILLMFIAVAVIGFMLLISPGSSLLNSLREKEPIIIVVLLLSYLLSPCMSYKQALKLTNNPDAASSALRKKIWWQTSRSNASVLFDQDYIALRLLRLPIGKEDKTT